MTDEAAGAGLPESISNDLPLLSQAYGLGEVTQVRHLPTGLMNRNWRLTTASGSYALKQISDVPLETARRNLAVVDALAARGVAACAALTSVGGDHVVEVAGQGYACFPWLSGSHVEGAHLTFEQARDLGALLGAIHTTLNDLAPHLAPALERPRAKVANADKAADEARRFLRLASQSPADAAGFGGRVREFLDERLVLLEKWAHERPTTDVPAGPFGWTHGDFQHLNVLWDETGSVAGVLDWDRIRVRPFAEEAARSATLLFGRPSGDLDLARVVEFTAGYRSETEVSTSEIADGVHRLWWKRMCDFWHLEFHYDRSDHSCDHLFFSASRFLRWWTSHRDEVQAAFGQ